MLGSGGRSIISEIAKYFIPVCVKSCSEVTAFNKEDNYNRSGINYNYMPSADAKWGYVLESLYTDYFSGSGADYAAALAGTGGGALMSTLAGWQALPKSQCHGDNGGSRPRDCMPFTGLEFSKIGNVCMFSLSAEAASAISDAASSAVDGMMESGVAEASKETMGNAWGDLQTAFPVLLLVTLLSICIGFAFLVLLRFIIGPLIWGSIFLVFALLVIGAAYFYYLSEECKEGSPNAANDQDTGNSTATNKPPGADSKCENGYVIEKKEDRQWYKYASYILLAFAAIYACIICCIARKIALAIAINKVAAKFVYQTKSVILVPIITIIAVIAWMIIWIVIALYVVSAFDNQSAPNEQYTYKIAYGVDPTCWICNDGVAGYCTNTWPTGWTWKDDTTNSKCVYKYDSA